MNEQNKLQRILQIKDEVSEFHPLLRQLIGKIEGTQRVEYTHGNQEHGADFVFSTQHHLFNDQVFIGVVAKVGAIRKAEAHRVIEQVRECHGERLFLNGHHKIKVDRICVITTGEIAPAAQRLIHEEFQTSYVEFIDRVMLIHLIDKFLKSYWSKVDVVVGNYLSEQLSQIQKEDAESLLYFSAQLSGCLRFIGV